MPIRVGTGYSDLFNDYEADEIIEADDFYVNNLYELDTGGGINFNNQTFFYDKLNIQTTGQHKYMISGTIAQNDRNYYIKDMGSDCDFVFSNGSQVVRDKTFVNCNIIGNVNLNNIVCNSIVSNIIEVIDKTSEIDLLLPNNFTIQTNNPFFQLFRGSRGYLEQLKFNIANANTLNPINVRVNIINASNQIISQKNISITTALITRTIFYNPNEVLLNEGEIYKILFDNFNFLNQQIVMTNFPSVYITNGFSEDPNSTLNIYLKINQNNRIVANTIINTNISGQNLTYNSANVNLLNANIISVSNELTVGNIHINGFVMSDINMGGLNIIDIGDVISGAVECGSISTDFLNVRTPNGNIEVFGNLKLNSIIQQTSGNVIYFNNITKRITFGATPTATIPSTLNANIINANIINTLNLTSNSITSNFLFSSKDRKSVV
jgi:hypothetical protein